MSSFTMGKVPCRNWISSGSCRFGSSCRFSHSGTVETQKPPSPPVANANTVDDLICNIGKLSISKKPAEEDLSSFHYSTYRVVKDPYYVAWRRAPPDSVMRPDIHREELSSILSRIVVFNADKASLPRLKLQAELPPRFDLRPFKDVRPMENKPNLLIAICMAVLSKAAGDAADIEKSTGTGVDDSKSDSPSHFVRLLRVLSAYDVILPRNPLKKIMNSSAERWEVYASRPCIGSPLFIERFESYETDEGTVGMLFEKALRIESTERFHKVYNVSHCVMGDVNLLLTGEVDCVDSSGLPVEIKAKPTRAGFDVSRLTDNWVQCKLIGVETIVTGQFDKNGKTGPAAFRQADVKYSTLSEFADRIPERYKDASFGYGYETVKRIIAECADVGAVYAISGQRGRPLTIRKCSSTTYQFPITEQLLQTLSEMYECPLR